MNDIHEHGTPELALRVEALEELLTEKGLLDSKAVDAVIHHFEHDVGPMDGAKVVARAWTDPDYKNRLLNNANSALEELGVGGREHLVVVENTPDIHNSSFVPCVLAIRGRYWGFPPLGTSRPPIAPASFANLVRS